MFAFDGCSTKNAFSSFNITPDQERSEENTKSSKIQNGNNIDGVVTAIYLNKAMPETYKENEFFYVYLYTKQDNQNIEFLLNGEAPLKVEELEVENMFTRLTSFKADWSKYYLVAFTSQTEELSLLVRNAEFTSNKLLFEKEEE